MNQGVALYVFKRCIDFVDMKHWLRQYEALANACMKRSTFFVPNVPKARFIAEGNFIFHAPSGVLHSAKTKKPCTARLLCFGGEGGIWTLAPVARPTPLAGAPLHHLSTSPFGDDMSYYSLFGADTCFSPPTLRVWRREWDSNPRGLAPKRFSRPPRYDRFDISPNILSSEYGTLPLSSRLRLVMSGELSLRISQPK